MTTKQARHPKIEPDEYPPDSGCFVARSCLNCPLPACWLENPAVLVPLNLHPRQKAEAEASALHISLKEWVRRTAEREGVQRSTVVRRLRLA